MSVGGVGVAASLAGVNGLLFMVDRSVFILVGESGGVASVAVLSIGVPGLVSMMVALGAKVEMSLQVINVSIRRCHAALSR